MRAVVQRVARAAVAVDGAVVGSIGGGLLVLAGSMAGDTATDIEFIARKVGTLRVFTDGEGKMNLSVKDTGGAVLLVSQFTLSADTTSGTRPSFSKALDPELAEPAIEELARQLRKEGLQVETGVFGAKMEVELVNDGPVTIIIDSQAKVRK